MFYFIDIYFNVAREVVNKYAYAFTITLMIIIVVISGLYSLYFMTAIISSKPVLFEVVAFNVPTLVLLRADCLPGLIPISHCF